MKIYIIITLILEICIKILIIGIRIFIEKVINNPLHNINDIYFYDVCLYEN